jgi:hypothetical protein
MSEGVSAWWKERRSSISDSMNLLPGNQPSYCPSMSYTTRLYGFAICLGLGILVAILSCIFIFFLNFVAFGVMYTVGNLLSIGSSLFLMGPIRQIKSMCAPVRFDPRKKKVLFLTFFILQTDHDACFFLFHGTDSVLRLLFESGDLGELKAEDTNCCFLVVLLIR